MSASVEGDRSEVLSLLGGSFAGRCAPPSGEGVDVSVEERRDRCVDCQGWIDRSCNICRRIRCDANPPKRSKAELASHLARRGTQESKWSMQHAAIHSSDIHVYFVISEKWSP